MGRKSRKKKLDRWWEECLKNAESATASQKANALNIFLDISAQFPVRRSEKFSRALNRVFDVYGDIIGSLVMVEFAKSEGFIRTKSPDNCLIGKELTN